MSRNCVDLLRRRAQDMPDRRAFLYLPDGEMARSNGDLVAKARQMTEDVGRRVATVAEARQMLGLKDRSQALRAKAAA